MGLRNRLAERCRRRRRQPCQSGSRRSPPHTPTHPTQQSGGRHTGCGPGRVHARDPSRGAQSRWLTVAKARQLWTSLRAPSC